MNIIVQIIDMIMMNNFGNVARIFHKKKICSILVNMTVATINRMTDFCSIHETMSNMLATFSKLQRFFIYVDLLILVRREYSFEELLQKINLKQMPLHKILFHLKLYSLHYINR